jgi:hypothetical protein
VPAAAAQNPAVQQQLQNTEPTGMLVALQVQGQAAPMVKSFLLGEP